MQCREPRWLGMAGLGRSVGSSSVAAPAKRDLIGELTSAARKRGMGIFYYYSYALDWRHPFFFTRAAGMESKNAPWDRARPDYAAAEPSYRYRQAGDFRKYIDFAHAQLRELLTQYLAQQPHIAKASGVKPEVVQQIQSILGWPATKEQVRAAMKYVPDELVQRITASGTPAEVKAKVREYIKYGATCPILYPLGDVKLMIDTFADGY